ncbi:hypothetical protein NL676_018402 [Syzygium grande]|nr:hypothetical protein NL676_018402 [Syzygium grande]
MSSHQNTRRRPSPLHAAEMGETKDAKWNSKGSDEVEEVRTKQKVDEHVWNDLVMVQQPQRRELKMARDG